MGQFVLTTNVRTFIDYILNSSRHNSTRGEVEDRLQVKDTKHKIILHPHAPRPNEAPLSSYDFCSPRSRQIEGESIRS